MSRQIKKNKKWRTIDISDLKNVPYFNFDAVMDSTDKEKGNNVIIDLIQQNLLPDNDRFYIGHNPQTNTYKIKEDPNQVEKDEIVAIIAAVDLEI